MKQKVIIGGIGICLVFLIFYIFDGKNIENYPPKNKTIVAFGDSLIEGYGATAGNDFVSIVGKELRRDIRNLGVSGNTSADGVARMDTVLKYNPGTVIPLLGGNDFLRNVPIETTEKNLRTIIERFTKEGIVVVLLGVRSGIFGGESDRMYERLHEEYKTVYLSDVLSGVFLRKELMHDAIHPNDRGYAIIADRVVSLFNENEL